MAARLSLRCTPWLAGMALVLALVLASLSSTPALATEPSMQSGEAASPAMTPNQAFFNALRREPGMQETASGLVYYVIQSGPADGQRPRETDTVRVHYAGTLIDGTEFDSSIRRGEPAEFPLSAVITGWTEAVQLMRPGDTWMVFLKPELAYGSRGSGRVIAPNSILVFTINLIAIVPPPAQ